MTVIPSIAELRCVLSGNGKRGVRAACLALLLCVVAVAVTGFGGTRQAFPPATEPDTVGPVTNLSASAVAREPGGVRLAWTPAENAHTHFVLYIRSEDIAIGKYDSAQVVAVTGSTTTIVGLQSGTSYHFVVRGMRLSLTNYAAVWGPWSDWVSETPRQVPNRPPEAVGTFPDLNLRVGETATLDISGAFRDPDGDPIVSHGFFLSNPDIAQRSSISDSGILTLRATKVGTTSVTVEAIDVWGYGTGYDHAPVFTLTVSGWLTANPATESCSNGVAIPDPEMEAGLVTDCKILLAARDTLAGDGELNWSTNRNVREWNGISVSGSPSRVTAVAPINLLSGELPPELGELASLLILSFDGSQLTGEIPPELGNLTNLERLALRDSQLEGEIPPELSDLTNLEFLWLGYNQLTGEIPHELGDLTNLKQLELWGNQLTGPIPTELGSMPSLGGLYLSDNRFTGEIPIELGDLTSLEALFISGNQLTGNIPPELANIVGLNQLVLDGNQLTGEIPVELGSLTNLTTLSLAGNRLTGSMPPELGHLEELWWLVLNDNLLTGSIPPELGNLANLWYLRLGDNQLNGAIPPELGNLVELRSLELANNRLTGDIPPELGNLMNLAEELWLEGNQLTGAIPPELGNLGELRVLEISDNRLTGTIPPQLGNLDELQWLGLTDNQLMGEIPPELGDLTHLHTLLLNNNQLTGAIPADLVNLVNLSKLRLGGNQFTGCLPVELPGIAGNHDLYTLGLPLC